MACGGGAEDAPDRASTVAAPTAATTQRVVLISVDGLNPTAITLLDRAGRVPAFRSLMAQGSFTLNARTSYEATNTLPNHTGILTGRRISGKAGTHVTFNSAHRGTLATLNRHYVPGVFDRVHDAGLRTAFLAGKSKFSFLIRSWNATGGARDVTGADNGRSKLDLAEVAGSARLVRDLVAQLHGEHPPALSFLHLKAPDEAGHGDKKKGFMGPRYLDAVTVADRQVGQVLAAIRTDPRLAGSTAVVVTADHGGRGTDARSGLGHRNPTRLANYRVPFLVWGPGIPARTNLYRLNPARRDPGKSRPTYAGRQPIRNFDATNLALGLLGLRPLPATLPAGLTVLSVR